jgi:hypothetical protein
VDKAQRTMALADAESCDVNKMEALAKSFAKNLKTFSELQQQNKDVQAKSLKGGRKAAKLCNRMLDGEVDKELACNGGSASGQDREAPLHQHRSKRRRKGEAEEKAEGSGENKAGCEISPNSDVQSQIEVLGRYPQILIKL